MIMLQFTWRPEKYARNLKEHGIRFEDVVDFLDDNAHVEWLDDREDYDDERIVSLASVSSKTLVIVYVDLGESLHLISARKADRKEVDAYYRGSPD
jgi:uncharacterized protein